MLPISKAWSGGSHRQAVKSFARSSAFPAAGDFTLAIPAAMSWPSGLTDKAGHMRSVLFVDPPAFCTTLEGLVAPELRTRPLAVAPPGADRAVIVALSAEARL